MAGAVAGVGVGLGLSCSKTTTTTKLSQRRSSSSKTTRRCCVKMAVSLDEKKKNYTLQKSEEAFAAAKDLMPGGVNSPVRAFKSIGGQPIIMDSVKGSRMWDIDGNEKIDYVGSWGPAIIGHADDESLDTVKYGSRDSRVSSATEVQD
ncbi:glutamate-1-semialdehyde 2,1-aminomutase 2, chloroplastic [Fagus crenata]